MNRDFPGRTFYVSAYLIFAIGFLTIHFTRVENFSAAVGGISVKGRSSVETALSPPQIRRVSLTANGLEIYLRKRNKAVIVTDDGIRHPLDVVGWEADEDSIRINFSSGVGFTLQTDLHGVGLRLVPEIPSTIPPVRSLELPFRPLGNADIVLSPNRPGILNISSSGNDYVASLPSDSSWNPGSGRLNLVVLGKADPILKVTDDPRGGDINALIWLEQGTIPSSGIYNRTVDEWMESVREGWKSRLDFRLGLWRDADGVPGWSDKLASAMLADAVGRGNLAIGLQDVVSAANRAPEEIGWLPSPYLGNIVNQHRNHARELRTIAAVLRSGIREGNPDFGVDSALTQLVDMKYTDEAAAMVAAARNVTKAPKTNAETLNRLRILHEARRLNFDNRSADRTARKKMFDEYLLPSIYWVKDGLWLVEDDGSVDLNLSVRAGGLMMREAQLTNNSVYQALGRQMVVSALGYADEDGLIPAKLLFESNGDVLRKGAILPENLYPIITDSPAYPRHVSLSSVLGPGAWAITGAEKFTVRSIPREITITMDFPVDSIHHLAIGGIKSFKVLYMNGIKWNSDPNFQRYYAGWTYDATSQTLYIKIRHRKKTETIRILYYDPEAVTTPEEETQTEG